MTLRASENAVGFGRLSLDDERRTPTSTGRSEAQQKLAQILAVKERGDSTEQESDDQLLELIKKLQALIKATVQLLAAGASESDPQIQAAVQEIHALKGTIHQALGKAQQELEQDKQTAFALMAKADGEMAGEGPGVGEDPETGGGISNGTLAQVFQMLHELQNKYNELNAMYSKVAQLGIEMSAAVTKATADCALGAILYEAYKEIVDGASSFVNACASLGNMVSNSKAMEKLNGEMSALKTEQGKLEQYQKAFVDGPKGRNIATDPAGFDPWSGSAMHPHDQAAIKEHISLLERGGTSPQFADTHTMKDGRVVNKNEAAIDHMTKDQFLTAKNKIDQQHAVIVQKLTEKKIDFQHASTQRGLMKDIGLGMFNAAAAGTKAYLDTERAQFQAAQVTGNENMKQTDKEADSNRQTGQGLAEQGYKIIESDIQALLSASRPN